MNEETMRWTGMQLRVLALVILLYTVDGIDNQMLAIVVPSLVSDWARAAAEFKFALAAGYVGTLIGASVGGVLSDQHGRKPVMVGCAMLFGAATLAMTLATQPAHLVILRVVSGLGLGGCIPPAIALLTECVQPVRRGIVVSLALLSPPLGIAISGLMGAAIISRLGWPAMFWIGGLLPLAVAILMLWLLPESPSYLARFARNRERLEKLVAKLGIALPEAATGKPGEKSAKSSLSQVLAPGFRAVALGIFGAFVFAQLALSMVYNWLPTLLTKAGFPLSTASVSLSVWSMSGIAGTLAAGWTISRWGAHRMSNIIVLATMGSALLLAFVSRSSTSDLPLMIGLIALTGCLSSGINTALYSRATEVFPASIRASGLGFSSMSGKSGQLCGALAGASLIGLNGITGFFMGHATCLLIALGCLNAGLLPSRRSRTESG
jgi:AAHS family 4-hydroxybenzoate transporter-like MFS transporter